jgi:M6 family metalloprotease-like protein
MRRLFATNEVSMQRSECIYAWQAAYLITEGRDCQLHVVVRIRLQPDADVTQAQLAAQQAIWEPAIEQAWTNRFAILLQKGGCECKAYNVTLDVQWVNSGEHHTVQVHSGSGRADMGNWFITSTGGTAAHEVGHMLGNPDEYPDNNCPARNVTNDNSIMRSSQSGQARPRHYQGFASWISNRTCCDYAVSTS